MSTILSTCTSTPPVEPVIRWTLTFHGEQHRLAALVVPGETPFDRVQFYSKYLAPEWEAFRPDSVEDIFDDGTSWVSEPLTQHLVRRLARAPLPSSALDFLPPQVRDQHLPWGLIWAVATVDTFMLDDPLRVVVDQSYQITHHLYKALWELRFTLKEQSSFDSASDLCAVIVKWMTAAALDDKDLALLGRIGIKRQVSGETELFELLLFLVTLAAQNGVFSRYVLCLDSLEHAPQARLRELERFLGCLDRWVRDWETPMGVLLGLGGPPENLKGCPKLVRRAQLGLEWLKR